LPGVLGADLLDYFHNTRHVPVALSQFAWQLRAPGLWAPIGLWTATSAWGFAGPAWPAPADLPEALPVRDGALSFWSLQAIDPEGEPTTPATTRFCTALATLMHWHYPTITRRSLHWIYRAMEWPWPTAYVARWFAHDPFWHYAWTHRATLALPQTLASIATERDWTATQLATVWPVSAPTIRRTVWPHLSTTIRPYRFHGRPVLMRLATGSACEQWRQQWHPTWPPLPGVTDPLWPEDPPYGWDPQRHQRLLHGRIPQA